jgi:hypothetical protein
MYLYERIMEAFIEMILYFPISTILFYIFIEDKFCFAYIEGRAIITAEEIINTLLDMKDRAKQLKAGASGTQENKTG